MKRHTFTIFLGLLFLVSIAYFTFNSEHILLGDDLIVTPQYIKLLKGKRVGVVANRASINSSGQQIIDVLHKNKKIDLVAIFTPEHGLRESLDQLIISDSVDKRTSLPVYSLYGKHRSPTKAQMEKIDVMLFDLQSVGVRYYTYISTLALVMKSAKKYHKDIIILDRPNPLGGNVVYGPLLDKNLTGTFTGYYPIPMRYGLTMGELARYYNKYFNIQAKLKVVPLKGWQRDMLFPATGQEWIAPSPGLRTFEQAYLYSIFGPLESMAFNVSRGEHGRHFDKVYGATWINEQQAKVLVEKIKALNLPGLKFKAVSWKTKSHHTPRKVISGFQVAVTDYKKVRGYYSLLSTLKILQQMFGDKMHLSKNNGMIGSAWIINAIKQNRPTDEMIAYDIQTNKAFIKNSNRIYLYH